MKYTIIRLDTLEMTIVEEPSAEEVEFCREGQVAIVDMGTGLEVCFETLR